MKRYDDKIKTVINSSNKDSRMDYIKQMESNMKALDVGIQNNINISVDDDTVLGRCKAVYNRGVDKVSIELIASMIAVETVKIFKDCIKNSNNSFNPINVKECQNYILENVRLYVLDLLKENRAIKDENLKELLKRNIESFISITLNTSDGFIPVIVFINNIYNSF